MANMAARILSRMPTPEAYEFYGGFATVTKSKDKGGDMYSGPNWFTENMENVY